MFAAFSLALMAACNSEAPAQDPASPAVEESAEQNPTELTSFRLTRSVNEIPRPRFNARHILIAHTAAAGASDLVSRDREEARAEAARILAELNNGADFAALAKAHSDDGSRSRGGVLGVFTTGVMHEDFEAATVALDVGARSELVETPFGFHIIERMPVVEVHVAHILVQWADVKRTRSDRSRAEAEARIAEAQTLLDKGTPFREVAIEFSDGPFGPRGGDLGWFQKGQMAPEFESVAFELDPGSRSAVVESPHGFHLILRIE